MSARLSLMLGKSQKEVADYIAQMEDKHCYPSHDVRLLAETTQAMQQKITSLGLDPHDTTGQELYHALQAKFGKDAALTDRALGIGSEDGFDTRLARAIALSQHMIGACEVWALKPTKARSVLRDLPPKKLMKQFGYRSGESMLKRQNVGELYLMMPYVESSAWQANFARLSAHLASNNYALQPINFVQPQFNKWSSLPEPPDLNICNAQTGSLTVWPAKGLSSAPVISLCLMLLRSVALLGAKADIKSLAAVHPSLHWWANASHLISLHDTVPVSLNIHDVAHNQLNSLAHEESVRHHGAKALWDELVSRYDALGDGLGQVVEDEISNLMPFGLAKEYSQG